MTAENANGASTQPGQGPAHSQSPAPSISPVLAAQSSALELRKAGLVAFGEWHRPTGRRHLGLVVVRTCPVCTHLHTHRAASVASVNGTLRTGSCGTAYVLSVVAAKARRRDAA